MGNRAACKSPAARQSPAPAALLRNIVCAMQQLLQYLLRHIRSMNC
jgi:hypothetical protein